MEKFMLIIVGIGMILGGVAISKIEASGDWPLVISYGLYAVGAWNIYKGIEKYG